MAMAMAIHGETPVLEDGSIKAEPMFYPSGITVNVFTGKTKLWNHPQHPKYCSTWGLTAASPILVHFHCSHAERAPYTREVLKLEKVMAQGWHPWLANAYAFIVRSIPQLAADEFKSFFRPLYRTLFGIRPVPVSQRIV